MKVTYAIVLNSGENLEPHIADYLLLSKEQDLPTAGVLGVNLEDKGGECHTASLAPGGAAEKAGVRKGDVVEAIDGQAIKSIADVHLALWDKKPGDRVRVKVRRRHDLWREIDRDLDLQLAAPPKVAGSASESRETSPIKFGYRFVDSISLVTACA
jgi:S1-C subfamily serine protease